MFASWSREVFARRCLLAGAGRCLLAGAGRCLLAGGRCLLAGAGSCLLAGAGSCLLAGAGSCLSREVFGSWRFPAHQWGAEVTQLPLSHFSNTTWLIINNHTPQTPN